MHDAVTAVRAGVDLEMPGSEGRTARQVVAAVEQGLLDEAVLDSAVARVLGLATERGVHDESPIDFDAQHRIASEVASQCAVLLKNTGVLPLTSGTQFAVVGEIARSPRYQGGGSSRVNSARVESFLGAARDLLGREVPFAPGYALDDGADSAQLRSEAVRMVTGAEVAVVFAGLREADESEGYDRSHIDLPQEQVELIKAVAGAAEQTVVVLSNGGVVSVEPWHDDVDAILEGFLLGQAGGRAIAELIFGEVNPSGHLAETIPFRLVDNSSTPNFPGEDGHVLYGERLLVGYRGYTALERPVRYPFGHGLSYTTFETSDFEVAVTGSDSAVVTVRVTSSGDRDGAHLVQIYVDSTSHIRVQRPQRELRAFAKPYLKAGESVTLELALDRRSFAVWDVRLGDWVVEPGAYTVQLGRDADTMVSEQRIMLDGDGIVRELTEWSTLFEWMSHPIVGPTLVEDINDDRFRYITQDKIVRVAGTMPMGRLIDFLGEDLPEGTFDRLMAKSRPTPTGRT